MIKHAGISAISVPSGAHRGPRSFRERLDVGPSCRVKMTLGSRDLALYLFGEKDGGAFVRDDGILAIERTRQT